jgi:hypothetical protein
MSSATLTDDAAVKTKAPSPDHASADAAQPWHFFVIVALAAATGAVLLSASRAPERLVMVSLTIFAAGGAALAGYHVLAPLVAERRRRRPVGGATRERLLAEKALALRTIKELEFDKAMGKVSEADFADMAGRLRARALRVMQQLDEAEK